MKIFFHGDMDGKCAGAIVYNYFKDKPEGKIIECMLINYNMDFPFDTIIKDEIVYIVDFSLQKKGDFEKLLKITPLVTWIDHHKTAIEKHAAIAHRLKGVRDISKAGGVLTWEFFYPAIQVPKIVELLGDYDTWTFKYGEITNYLQNGIRLNNTDPTDDNWRSWLGTKSQECADDICREGKICLLYRNNYYGGLVKSWAFPVEFEGYKCIACNAGSVSSQLFDSVEEDYDIMMPFVFDGKQWTVSLYTKKKDIDVSDIAKKYGGGGHKQASGFQCEKLPW
jgi:oligoribonuclease NrnB/cAMP/cGMP phosphodiesterase (DHH superfamily)